MSEPLAWWQTRRYALLLVLLAAVPILFTDIPPLTDLLGHVGRYGVQLNIDTSPYLKHYYGFRWALLGNLGVDLIVEALGPVVGIERTVWWTVCAIPMLGVAGLLWSAREAHGRLPASAAFALPIVYGYPFEFGFVNYALSMALAFLLFALWLRLGRQRRIALRAALFVPLGPALWVVHTYGWGVLCLLALAAETIRWQRSPRWPDSRIRWLHCLWHGGLSCLPLAPPLLLMLLWRSGAVAGQTTDWFNFSAKYIWVVAALRDRWMWWDIFGVGLMFLLMICGLARGGFRYEPRLGVAAALLVLTYLLLPRILLGSAYADMRLAPWAIGAAVLGLAPRTARPRLLAGVAACAFAFYAARIGGTSYNYIQLDKGFDRQLAAVDHIPRGSRVLVLIDLPCTGRWSYSRMDHLGSIAIERREAFVNGEWSMAGAQLLTIRNKAAGRFAGDPTQLLRPLHCRRHGEPALEDTLDNFPRNGFDYLWMVDRPPEGWVTRPDLAPVWHGARGILYRVVKGSATAASETPNGRERVATQ